MPAKSVKSTQYVSRLLKTAICTRAEQSRGSQVRSELVHACVSMSMHRSHMYRGPCNPSTHYPPVGEVSTSHLLTDCHADCPSCPILLPLPHPPTPASPTCASLKMYGPILSILRMVWSATSEGTLTCTLGGVAESRKLLRMARILRPSTPMVVWLWYMAWEGWGGGSTVCVRTCVYMGGQFWYDGTRYSGDHWDRAGCLV